MTADIKKLAFASHRGLSDEESEEDVDFGGDVDLDDETEDSDFDDEDVTGGASEEENPSA